jgi:hypothetical protein
MANFDHVKNDRPNNDRDEGAFDGGEDGDDDEGSHLPVVIIIAIIVLAAFGGVVWMAYNQGLARGRNDVPARVAATQATKTDDSGLKVYQQSAGPEEEGAKAAAPQPVTPPVQAQPQAPAQAQVQPQPAPVQPAPAQPAPKTMAQAAPPVVTPPAPKPQQMAAAKPAPAKPGVQDLAPQQPQVATKPPAALGAARPATQMPAAPATAPLKPATLKPVAEAAAKPAATGGSYLLQIGAYKSDEDARTAWKTYQSKHAALLNGFGPDVQRTTHDDGSVWYRLRIASFSDKDTAAAVCERLKAQGAACFVAK